MPITYNPTLGEALWCTYDGMEPEMVKRRVVVVISPRAAIRPGLVTVIPLSATLPAVAQPWHVKLDRDPGFYPITLRNSAGDLGKMRHDQCGLPPAASWLLHALERAPAVSDDEGLARGVAGDPAGCAGGLGTSDSDPHLTACRGHLAPYLGRLYDRVVPGSPG